MSCTSRQTQSRYQRCTDVQRERRTELLTHLTGLHWDSSEALDMTYAPAKSFHIGLLLLATSHMNSYHCNRSLHHENCPTALLHPGLPIDRFGLQAQHATCNTTSTTCNMQNTAASQQLHHHCTTHYKLQHPHYNSPFSGETYNDGDERE